MLNLACRSTDEIRDFACVIKDYTQKNITVFDIDEVLSGKESNSLKQIVVKEAIYALLESTPEFDINKYRKLIWHRTDLSIRGINYFTTLLNPNILTKQLINLIEENNKSKKS